MRGAGGRFTDDPRVKKYGLRHSSSCSSCLPVVRDGSRRAARVLLRRLPRDGHRHGLPDGGVRDACTRSQHRRRLRRPARPRLRRLLRLGAYTLGWFGRASSPTETSILDTNPVSLPGIHMSFWVVMILAGVVAGLAGLIIGWPTCACAGTTSRSSPWALARSSPTSSATAIRCRCRRASRKPSLRRVRRPQPHERSPWSHAARSPWVRRDAG